MFWYSPWQCSETTSGSVFTPGGTQGTVSGAKEVIFCWHCEKISTLIPVLPF